MIERNIGNVERLLRLAVGVVLLLWAALQPLMNGIEWFVVLISAALILNGVFQRCYLWYLLDISSEDASPEAGAGCRL